MKDIPGFDENGNPKNGQLWDEGRFAHGKKKGTLKIYNEAGEVIETQTFK